MNHPPRHRQALCRSCFHLAAIALALLVAACGDNAQSVAGNAASNARPQPASSASVPPDGATAEPTGAEITLGSTDYPFRIVRCDLPTKRADGQLLQGSGTAADGRRFTVRAERIKPGDIVFESATLQFGSFADGDMWIARRGGYPDGRWFTGEALGEAVNGPLLQVSADTLMVEGLFRHETSGAAEDGVLRVTCDS